MKRDHDRLFSAAHIGPLALPNRLVRSATWDPAISCVYRQDRELCRQAQRWLAGWVRSIDG